MDEDSDANPLGSQVISTLVPQYLHLNNGNFHLHAI